GLGDQLAHDRRAFARDVPEPIFVTRLVLARNEPEVPADRFGIAKAVWVIHECYHRLGSANAHSWNAAQLSDGGRLLRLAIQLLFDTSHLADQRLDLFEQEIPAQLLRSRGQ